MNRSWWHVDGSVHSNKTIFPRRPQYFFLWLDYVGFRADRRGFGAVLWIRAARYIWKAQQQLQRLTQENTTLILITIFLFLPKNMVNVLRENTELSRRVETLEDHADMSWIGSVQGQRKNNGIFWTSLLKPPKSPWKIQILLIKFCGLTIQKM